MYWKQKSPAVTSSRINFYYQPSMAEVAAMLVSSPESFDFSYVRQINADQQYNLLSHFEDIYDVYPDTRDAIDKMLGTIEFGANAKCQFVISGKRYGKFPALKVDRVSAAHHIESLHWDYALHKTEIDKIVQSILLSKGQGAKIEGAIRKKKSAMNIFVDNVVPAIESISVDHDPVSVARNISKTNVLVPPEAYDKLASTLTMVVLADDLHVKTETVNKHMKNIRR